MSIFDETTRQLELSMYAYMKFPNMKFPNMPAVRGWVNQLAEEYERYKTATPSQRQKLLASRKGRI
jgi:hypothetical protein